MLLLCALLATCFLGTTEAFAATPSSTNTLARQHLLGAQKTSSVLHERKWNFNDGQGPFGMKKNAEIWNGRLAQVCHIHEMYSLLVVLLVVQGEDLRDTRWCRAISFGHGYGVAMSCTTHLS